MNLFAILFYGGIVAMFAGLVIDAALGLLRRRRQIHHGPPVLSMRYGATPEQVRQLMDADDTDANVLIEKYLMAYPGLRPYYQRINAQAEAANAKLKEEWWNRAHDEEQT